MSEREADLEVLDALQVVRDVFERVRRDRYRREIERVDGRAPAGELDEGGWRDLVLPNEREVVHCTPGDD